MKGEILLTLTLRGAYGKRRFLAIRVTSAVCASPKRVPFGIALYNSSYPAFNYSSVGIEVDCVFLGIGNRSA